MKRTHLVATCAGISLACFMSCSSEKDQATLDPGSDGTGRNTGIGSVGTGGSSATGGGVERSRVVACKGLPVSATGAAGAGPDPNSGGACATVDYEAEAAPVDMYIMMDRSSSMAEPIDGSERTRWQGVQDAIQQFADDPRAKDLGVGIQFFGQSLNEIDDTVDCNVDRYATPEVGIAPLSTNDTKLVETINDTRPFGFTPMHPALEGALIHAKDWAANHPERATIVVLVTDGLATQCSPQQPAAIAELAAEAFTSEPSVRTYVIGLEGGLNLDAIAREGGTGEAFLIDQGDVGEPFLQRMLNFTEASVLCEFAIPAPPEGEALDADKVQVVYDSASDPPEEVPRVSGPEGCDTSENGGWYYNNSSHPTRIRVCPCTCARFGAGSVQVRIGCAPRYDIR